MKSRPAAVSDFIPPLPAYGDTDSSVLLTANLSDYFSKVDPTKADQTSRPSTPVRFSNRASKHETILPFPEQPRLDDHLPRSLDEDLEDAWKLAEEKPHVLSAIYRMFCLSQQKHQSFPPKPTVAFNVYFVYLYALHQIARKCRESGLGDVDWWPFAPKDDVIMLVPFMKKQPCNLVPVS
jgi:hypothetical protein